MGHTFDDSNNKNNRNLCYYHKVEERASQSYFFGFVQPWIPSRRKIPRNTVFFSGYSLDYIQNPVKHLRQSFGENS